MVDVDLRELSDQEVIKLIEDINNSQSGHDLIELKNLLAEVTNRKLGSEYADIVNTLIHNAVAVVPSNKQNKAKQDVISHTDSKAEDERFPVLNFLSKLYKVLAWFSLVACITIGCSVGYVYFFNEIVFIAASVFGGVIVGTKLLLVFYSCAESISLKLEIERNLRQLIDYRNI